MTINTKLVLTVPGTERCATIAHSLQMGTVRRGQDKQRAQSDTLYVVDLGFGTKPLTLRRSSYPLPCAEEAGAKEGIFRKVLSSPQSSCV